MKRQYKLRVIAAIILTGLIFVIAAEKQTGIIRRAIFNHDFFSGNYNHFLPCSKLPTEEEVERVLREHRDVIEKIKQIRQKCSVGVGKTEMLGTFMHVSFGKGEKYKTPSGSYNSIYFVAPASSQKCPGKADIYIEFGGISDSVLIKEIIGGDTFFGIPYRMHNI